MTIIEAMRAVLKDGWDMGEYEFPPDERRVTVQVAQIEMFTVIEAYNALAPVPDDWPDWAHWCVVNANGLQYFCDGAEPRAEYGATGWTFYGARAEFYRELTLPIGLDWRLCKQRRPAELP